jgi:16S rRNA (guanine(1405)-N(7))-methyltransferase
MSEKNSSLTKGVKVSSINPNKIIERLFRTRKYRGLNIPIETAMDLVVKNAEGLTRERDLEDVVREKMHNLIAPYLDTLDYPKTMSKLDHLLRTSDSQEIKELCLEVLSSHSSTKERIPIMEGFYATLFRHTGIPETILDLACGLNPFSIPWMKLPNETKFYSYDIHEPRIHLINAFLSKIGMQPLAIKQDILINPPKIEADVAFFFKEAHRFEQRQHGCNRDFWKSIHAKHLLVSLPTRNLTGRHSMIDQQRHLVERTTQGLPWTITEFVFDNEIVFCIEKE